MSRRPPKLGQHFLHDPAVAHRIVDALEPEQKTVLEIGPGRGVLTFELAERAGRLVAVELDRRLADDLAGALAASNASIECGDILDRPLAAWIERGEEEEFRVVGNLPYAITSPVLFACFEAGARLQRAVLMMQREVAQRLVAGPGSRTYGLLSVIGAAYAEIDLLFTVGRGAFKPPPAVTSAVVRVDPHRELPHGIGSAAGPAAEWFRQVVRASFGQRRKMLRNSLKAGLDHLSADRLEDAARETGIDLTRRAESLTLEEYVRLARALPEPKPV